MPAVRQTEYMFGKHREAFTAGPAVTPAGYDKFGKHWEAFTAGPAVTPAGYDKFGKHREAFTAGPAVTPAGYNRFTRSFAIVMVPREVQAHHGGGSISGM